MLTTEHTRKIIGNPDISEKELTDIRNALYQLADLAIDSLIDERIDNAPDPP